MSKTKKFLIGILIAVLGLIILLLPLAIYIYPQYAISNANKKSTISEQQNITTIENTSKNSIATNSQNNSDTLLESMIEQEKEAFNSNFTPYEGSHSGAQIAGLVKKVMISNQSFSDDLDRQISMEFMGELYSGDNISNISSLVKNSDIYNITLKYSSDNLIEIISINQ